MLNQVEYHQFIAQLESGIFNLFVVVAISCVALYPMRNRLKRLALPTGFRMPLIATLGIAILLRVPHMNETFWYDETFSAGIAQMSMGDFFTAINADVHPPLYYFILWNAGNLFGYAEWVMRSPSLLFGLMSIWVMYRLTWSITGSKRHAQMSAFLLAILPAHIQYSTEARAYMLLTLLVLLTVWAIVESWHDLFMVAGMGLPFTHAYGYIYIGVLLLFWIWKTRQIKPHWFAVVPPMVTALAWLPFLINQSGDVADGFWIAPLTIEGIPKFMLEMTVGNLAGQWVMGVYIPIAGIILLSLWTNRRWLVSSKGLTLLGVIVGVPLIISLISFVWRPIYLTRALLPCAVLSIVLWSMLLENQSSLRNFYRTIFIPGLIIATVISGLNGVDNDIRSFFTECEGVDYVFATSPATGIMALYYAPAPVRLWTQANNNNQYLTDDAKDAWGFVQSELEDLRGDVCIPLQINPQVDTDRLLSLPIYQYEREMKVMLDDSPLYKFLIYRLEVS